MKSQRLYPVLSVAILVLAMLACNGSGSSGADNPSTAESTPVGEAPTTESSAAGAGCNNPYYPVFAGATWTYSMTGTTPGGFTRSITTISADGFSDQDVFIAGVTRTGEWKCNHGALIALNPSGGSTASVQTENNQSTFVTTAMDGVTIPAVILAGDTWTQTFTIEGQQSINGQNTSTKNDVVYSCTAGAAESVTVPAGTFDAIRVDCQMGMSITISMEDLDIPPTVINTTTTSWYAPEVGWVKSVDLSDFGSNTIELTAYNIP